MSDRKSVTKTAQGKWKSILVEMGVEAKVLDGRHHPCPVTGEGEDRFRFSNRDGKGSFFCGCNNGSSDGFKLIECKFGKCFKEAAKDVEKIVNDMSPDDESDKRDSVKALRDLKTIQSVLSRDRRPDEVVLAYLRGRGLSLAAMPRGLCAGFINYGLRAININDSQSCMVAKFVDPEGKPVTYHITYLEGAQKASHKRSRIIMTPSKPMAGGAVRLAPMGEDGVLGVAEGIETALSASAMHAVPVWATLNAAMLELFKPPKDCKRLMIFADNDGNFTGQAAAFALAKKCQLIYRIPATVFVPQLVDTDFNDNIQQAETP